MGEIHSKVRAYYSAAVERWGPTPQGVDWQSAAAQYLRFVQLLKICSFDTAFSLNDFGCGCGALLDYLALRHDSATIAYRGIDLSFAMIEAATKRWAKRRDTTFVVGSTCNGVADYSLASGVFNVRLGEPIDEWEAYVESILADLRVSSRIGFAVNFKLPLDNGPMEDNLYRTRQERWMTLCRKRLGCEVETLVGYGLREFTLLASVQT
jgi:SAM-dependent methyltransferase